MDRALGLDPALAARFAADIAAIRPRDIRVGLAVSGGPDSLALLLLAHARLPGEFEVATVDHGLRPESADEAALVTAYCAQLAVPHTTLPVTVATSGNLPANARAARYAALAAWAGDRGLGAIVTAHHADDQAETLLMRLARGSGVRGLAAMRAGGEVPGAAPLALLRPLLGWRRVELSAIVAEAGWRAVADPSNADPRFDRARLREALTAYAGPDLGAVAHSAALLREAAEALTWARDREFDAQVSFGEGGSATYRPTAPRAIRFDVVRLLVDRLGAEGSPRGAEFDRFLATLEAGGVATLGGLRGDARNRSAWTFAPASPRKVR